MVHLATPHCDSTEDRTRYINLKFLERPSNPQGIPITYTRKNKQVSNLTVPSSHPLGSLSSSPMAGAAPSGNQTAPPPQNSRVFGRKAKASPLDFSLVPGAPHDMLENYFEKVPKFDGVSATSIEDHIDKVWDHMDEDVFMRGISFYLEGDVRKWFDRLPTSSINGYDHFIMKLRSDWSHKLDGKFLLHHLFDIKKRENETIHEFNLRFDKTVGNIPKEIRPKDQVIIIHYLNAFDGWLGFNLKDKNLNDLKTAQFNAKMAEHHATSMGKQNFFDHYAPSTSRSESKL